MVEPKRPHLMQIISNFDLGAVLIIIGCGIAVGVVQHSAPAQRPVFTQDAAIAYKYMGARELHFAVAMLVPFVLLLVTAILFEFVLNKAAGTSERVALFVNVILGFMAAVAVVGFMTELLKRICGRLRPDFLDRCQPLELSDNTVVPYGTFPNVLCQNKNGSVLKDGHMSFPSGHSSCSMAISLYAAMYLVYCVYLRSNGAHAASMTSPAQSLAGRLGRELCSIAVLLVLLFEIAWPWGVAASRFIDNRHNVSDVVAGLLLGMSFTPLFVLRMVKHYSACSSQLCLASSSKGGAGHVLPVTAGDAGAGAARHRADMEGTELVAPSASGHL